MSAILSPLTGQYICPDGNSVDNPSNCGSGITVIGGGPVSSPTVSPGGIFGSLGGLLTGIATDVATDFRAVNMPVGASIQNIPGVGTLVNGQIIPNSGLNSLTSGNGLLFIIAAIIGFLLLRKK